MKAEKDPKTGKWLIQYRYKDWTGKLRKSTKRGFDTNLLSAPSTDEHRCDLNNIPPPMVTTTDPLEGEKPNLPPPSAY